MSDNGRLDKILKTDIPEGFRPLTSQELAKYDELALKMAILKERVDRLDQTIRAAKAEMRVAELEKDACRRGMDDLQKAGSDFGKTIGITDPSKDRLIVNGAVYVRANEKKK